jgi:hypothetical protein
MDSRRTVTAAPHTVMNCRRTVTAPPLIVMDSRRTVMAAPLAVIVCRRTVTAAPLAVMDCRRAVTLDRDPEARPPLDLPDAGLGLPALTAPRLVPLYRSKKRRAP